MQQQYLPALNNNSPTPQKLGSPLPSTYLYTGPDGGGHESVGPLQGQFVDPPVQFLHGDRLGVEDVGVAGLVERVLYPRGVEVGQSVL